MTYDEIKIREKGRPIAEEKVAEIYSTMPFYDNILDQSNPYQLEDFIEILVNCFLAGYKEKENEMEGQR